MDVDEFNGMATERIVLRFPKWSTKEEGNADALAYLWPSQWAKEEWAAVRNGYIVR